MHIYAWQPIRTMEKTHFKVAQKAVIKQGDSYLIVKRSLSDNLSPGYWEFPGGKLEAGEEPSKGLEREVLEETGLQVRSRNPVFVFSESNIGYNIVFIIWEVELISGEVELSSDHSDFKWATREEILKLPKAENFLTAYLKSL